MYFEYKNRKVFYNIEGSGPVILFLHGLGGNANNWLYQRQYFKEKWTVISLDLPGHGKSEGLEINFKEYVNVLYELCKYLKLQKVVICGLSKGARVGIDFAIQYPDFVSSLIIVNAFPYLEPEDRKKRLEVYDLLSLHDNGKKWADTLLEEMGVASNEVIVRGFYQSLQSINPVHIQRLFAELVDYDQRPLLLNISCSTLIIRGENDDFVPEKYVREFERRLKNTTFIEFKNSGHLPYLEQPSSFNMTVEKFLNHVIN
ncbi:MULTISPECIES: alpha/beta fold hydrolase [Bacillus]|uniref:alpha/beta fold hydrolase n=1 Tax=Bacillus TaxID=1386 RepID=UPI0003071D1D|nr:MULTISPECIES: alpha/beta hydrolase [Bacillus]HDR4427851.1 alpha/beta hydrolase [Bacillus cereus]ARZ63836.1 alpha/beta hydrolase [Bacillus thuringiensis]MEB9631400.1 alpha/beta hydrolase [Bacillus anthracis]OUB02511.1 alpha/beta hydrolase [Bacillus thuringiensis serovar oswaldocruzi]TNO94296.1 alpha/beta hydrolase [Bacillus sp. CD3-1a]